MVKLLMIESEAEYQRGLAMLNSEEKQNLVKALVHFDEAAKMGHAEAVFQKGYLYLHGEPQIKMDIQKAVECFEEAAKNGVLKAMYCLAVCYLNGVVEGKSKEEGFDLAIDTFRAGNIDVIPVLCECYQFGIGVEKNLQSARVFNSYARRLSIPGSENKYVELLMMKKDNKCEK